MNQREIAKKTGAQPVGNYEHGSDEWLEARKAGIGGSDLAAILGWSPYKSFYSLWAEKTGIVEAEKLESQYITWGHNLEPAIIDHFEREHPEYQVIRNVGTWTRKEYPFLIANPDALFVDADGQLNVLEIKTAGRADAWTDGVPIYYQAQVQHYMITLGIKKSIVAVLIGGNDYREYIIEADEFGQSVIIDQVKAFLHYVESKNEPMFDGSKSTYEVVRRMHPEINDEVVEIPSEHVKEYIDASTAFDSASESLNLAKTKIMGKMGKAKTGTVQGEILFARQARGGGSPYLVYKGGK